MKAFAFAGRCAKELCRDVLTLIFCIGFPLVMLLLFAFLQDSIPVEFFHMRSLAPAVSVFGLSFLSLFTAMLISKDRASAFLARLFVSPMTSADFIAGYTLPLLAVAAVQLVVCFGTALCFGYPLTADIMLAFAASLPTAVFFIATGIIFGLAFTDKAVGGAASILVNASALLSGTWFDVDMIGGGFRSFCRALPFWHAVNSVRLAAAGDFAAALPSLGYVSACAAVLFIAAAAWFSKTRRSI
jgi:ABC-2 type transport system permease protein